MEDLDRVIHAIVVPAPAAYVSDKVNGSFDDDLVLLLHDGLFLAKCADHSRSAHGLIEVAFERLRDMN